MPDKTQPEILEALGQLGGAVKQHLFDATKSGLYAVRRRAIEMLLPHLSDDELFTMDHTLSDRSREPIKTFLIALLERDAERAIAWLMLRKHFEYKACQAIGDLIPVFAAHLSSNVLFDFISNIFRRGSGAWVRREFLRIMAHQLKDDVRIWQLIREAAIKDPDVSVRSQACGLLLSASNCDELHRRMMLRNLDEGWRGYDPKEPVTIRRIAYVAQKLGLSTDELRRQYEELANRLQIELNLEWRKPS